MRRGIVLAWLTLAACRADEVAGSGGGSSAPTPVDVAPVRSGSLQDAWRLAADVRALSRASLAPQVAGRVDRVAAREGDRVTKGTALVVVDPGLARADVAAREADRDAAKVERERAERAVDRLLSLDEGVVSAQQRDDAIAARDAARARHTQAEAAWARADEVLARHTVRAPFSGVVALRRVDPGDFVAVGQAVLELVADEGVEVVVDGPAGLVGTLSTGQAVTLEGPGGQTVEAALAGLVPALDPVSRTVRARLTPTDTPDWLLPGASVTAILGFDRQDEAAVVVPRDALLEGAGTPALVLVTPEGTAKRVEVSVLARTELEALVRGEVAAGDRVVTRGNERIRPGAAVSVRSSAGEDG